MFIMDSMYLNRMWNKAQQEVRQHWFIDRYIAAYKQVLYRVTGVHPTGLTVDQGCRKVSTSKKYHYVSSGQYVFE
jgi:hypothetical protein